MFSKQAFFRAFFFLNVRDTFKIFIFHCVLYDKKSNIDKNEILEDVDKDPATASARVIRS